MKFLLIVFLIVFGLGRFLKSLIENSSFTIIRLASTGVNAYISMINVQKIISDHRYIHIFSEQFTY